MRKLFFLLSMCAAGWASAQKIPDPRPFANMITADDLKTRLFKVASKEFQGRETATEGQRIAAAYIEDQFRTFGFAPGNGNNYQQLYPVFQDTLLSAELTVNDASFTLDKEFFVSLASNNTATLLGSEVV